MALKRIVTETEYKKLSKDIQGEYKQDGDNFVLDLDGYEDPVELKRAKDHEKKARKDAESKLNELSEQLKAITEERDGLLAGTVAKGDVDKITKNAEAKLAKREKELSEQIAALTSSLRSELIDGTASKLVNEISTSPSLLLPHVVKRLTVEQVDGKFVTRILDAEGKPSDLSVEGLKKEILANKDFSPILTASKATGGGASGGSGTGGAGSSKVDYNKADPKTIASNSAIRQKAEEVAKSRYGG